MKKVLVLCVLGILLSCQKKSPELTTSTPPAVDLSSDNELVIVAGYHAKLIAFNANDGTVKWEFRLNSDPQSYVPSSPAIVDGVVYICSSDRNIYAVDLLTGAEKWRFKTGSFYDYMPSSPIVVNGAVYVGDNGKTFYALDAKTGALKWKREFAREFDGSACYENNIIYTGCDDNILYALDPQNGSTIWQIGSSFNSFSSYYHCVQNGVLYAIARGSYPENWSPVRSRLFVLNALTGKELNNRKGYEFSSAFYLSAAPTVEDSVLYIGGDTALYAINTKSLSMDNTVWKYKLKNETSSAPTFDSANVYTADMGAIVYALNKKDGSLKWSFNTLGDRIMASPVVANGILFIGTYRGFFALDATTGKKKWFSNADSYFASSACVVTKQGQVFYSSKSGMRN